MSKSQSLPYTVCNSSGVNLALHVYLQPKPVAQPAAKKDKVSKLYHLFITYSFL